MNDWEKTKAVKMIDAELRRISESQFPDDQFCCGMIQLAYALGLISNDQELALTETAADVVRERRRVLRMKKIDDAIGRMHA